MSQAGPEASEAGFYCPAYVGLRCVLLMVVLQGHYWLERSYEYPIGILSFAVPFFFCLSGYLISHTLFAYEGKLPRGRALTVFYMRRALRILPAYYLVLAVAHLIRGVPYLFNHLLYTINFKIFQLSAFDMSAFSAYVRYRDFNAMHFWSVCVEEQFYLLYPLFVLFFPKRFRVLGLVTGIACCIAMRLYLRSHYPESFFGGLPLIAGEYILWSCLLAWVDFQGRWTWLRGSGVLYGSLLAFFGVALQDSSFERWAQWRPPVHQTYYCIVIALFILALRYNHDSWLGRLLQLKPLQFVGSMSYGAYLVHSFLNPVVDAVLAMVPALAIIAACPRAVLGPVLTVGVAALLWYGFERPFHALRGRWRTL